MKRVLIVSYFFPPQPYIGSLRLGKLAKYLPEYGWEPVVLTVDPGRKYGSKSLPIEMPCGRVIRTRDFDITNELKKMVHIDPNASIFNIEGKLSQKKITKLQRVKNKAIESVIWFVNQFVSFPDTQIGWYFIVKKHFTNVLKECEADILFTSSSPSTSHLIGRSLKSELNVPWVADFRDLWTQNHISRRVYPLWKIEQKVEKNVLKMCDAITTVSKPLAEQLLSFHGKPVTVVTNGFDEDDYTRIHPGKINKTGKLRIVYTGKIYPNKQDPSLLFRTVKDLLNEGFIRRDELEIDFYGGDVSWAKRISHNMGMEEIVNFCGLVPYSESIQKQMESDILLLLEWTDNQAKGVYTGKLFEYLGAGKPILAVGPKCGVVDELLRETGAGVLVSNHDDTKSVLKEWITLFRQKGFIPYDGRGEIISKYSRRLQAKILAELFDNLTEEKQAMRD